MNSADYLHMQIAGEKRKFGGEANRRFLPGPSRRWTEKKDQRQYLEYPDGAAGLKLHEKEFGHIG